MRSKIRNSLRLFNTLRDIGSKRVFLRIVYELKNYLDRVIPFRIAIFLTKGTRVIPKFKKFEINKYLLKNENCKSEKEFKGCSLNILNRKIRLDEKVNWDNIKLTRLERFNVHYFDWAREWLDSAIDKSNWDKKYFFLNHLIDSWIDSTSTQFGDGWHSYTTSLRVRNWLWLIQFCPQLNSQKIVDSLWQQICWLRQKPESCHGGNHWLENLITLCIAAIQFDNSYSKEIYKYALYNLKIELDQQILSDGGHEERSASYHIIILDRLVELSCVLKIYRIKIPIWLIDNLKIMNEWISNVRLINGGFPNFNDNILGTCPNLEEVYFFSEGLLNKKNYKIKGLRGAILSLALENKNSIDRDHFKIKREIVNLNATGWTIFSLGNKWELIFKCGTPCPSHLAAHVHSDQLTFEFLKNGKKIVCETGTTTYEKGKARNFERSIKSHNTIQLGLKKRKEINWIEPVDVWDVFKAGRKCNPLKKDFGIDKNWKWVQGSHDGFSQINSSHFRWMAIDINKDNKPVIIIIDRLISLKKISTFKSWIHLSPFYSTKKNIKELSFEFWHSNNIRQFQRLNKKGYLAKGFKKSEKRTIIELNGVLSKGTNTLITVISDPKYQINCEFINTYNGNIFIDGVNQISWNHRSEKYLFMNTLNL